MRRNTKRTRQQIRALSNQRYAMELVREHNTSRAMLASYAEDLAALRGIGLVSATEVRYSERWTQTQKDLRHLSTTTEGVFIPGTVRAKIVHVTLPTGEKGYRSAESFRKKSVATKQRQNIVATRNIPGHSLAESECAAMPAIGNID